MNILIVDDDAYVIESIQLKMNWDRLTINEVYTANNARQARRLLLDETIDILICDIEMPQETGLELVQWIREKGYMLQTIFLTSFADFDYAKKALELDSLEYFLKPIEYDALHKGILKAVERVEAFREQQKQKEQSQLWVINQDNILEAFWKSIIEDHEYANEEEIHTLLKKYHSNYSLNQSFIPILIHFFNENNEAEKWQKSHFKSSLKAATNGIYKTGGYELASMILLEDDTWLILLEAAHNQKDYKALKQLSEEYLQHMHAQFNAIMLCEIGTVCDLLTIQGVVKQLKKVRTETIIMHNQVILLNDYKHHHVEYPIPALGVWEALLTDNKIDILLRNVESYLKSLTSRKMLTQEILNSFRLDFTQLVYSFLKQKEISAHKLFATQSCEHYYHRSIKSIHDMLNYTTLLIERAVEYSHYTERTDSVVGQLKEYIDKNFEKDITRNDLAEIVYLNADYISRLFKKEVGSSITSYLLGKRMKKAKELLLNSDMPISEVSIHVGYSNFSYFTKLFKDNTGYSPNKYRKKMRVERGE